MTTSTLLSTKSTKTAKRSHSGGGDSQHLRGGWWRFLLIAVVTSIVLIPIAAVVILSLQPSLGSQSTSLITFENYASVFAEIPLFTWLGNSLAIALGTVASCIVVAAPAGYVLSRGRSRLVSSFSLTLFVFQALPVVTAVIPLFILFVKLGLVDSLLGVMIIHVGAALSIAIWMMAAYYDSIPITLEEAAWMDGCSIFGSFTKVVLRNSFPALLSTSIFTFLLSWNDYLISLVFLRSENKFTLPIGLQTFFQQNSTDWGAVMAVAVVMMLPPTLLFLVLNRYFSFGGIGGSLAGR